MGTTCQEGCRIERTMNIRENDKVKLWKDDNKWRGLVAIWSA